MLGYFVLRCNKIKQDMIYYAMLCYAMSYYPILSYPNTIYATSSFSKHLFHPGRYTCSQPTSPQ